MQTLHKISSQNIHSLGLGLLLTSAFITHSAKACMPIFAEGGRNTREMESTSQSNTSSDLIDSLYPGTAVTRLQNVHKRVKSLTPEQLSQDWQNVRRSILWAGGLKDLSNVRPGKGYTGHSFNDFNHCDLTTMRGDEADNNNEGKVAGIAYNNRLGEGIRIASIEELGPGGSWSTCMIGCNKEPPQDVAHIQFKSRIAFKLVWTPPTFNTFVLVDDSGSLLNWGTPTGTLPHIAERRLNFETVAGSKYAVEAERKGKEMQHLQ
ncbi:uncharacterized protein LOC130694088 [Daphnia carinata]|uniref:uncharacterized protein LOC130694088 n=1 Tax=Daphnia carinata TaxID=120202 RepID=UPI00257DAE7B|nr:uncharacterized protein LOC130694088 [Daphnia carinata]